VISVPRHLAALVRNTSLEVSAKDFAKVRCSCGRNGLRKVGIFSNKLLRVSRMAAISNVRENGRKWKKMT
jgi:hypothetical protein